MNRKRIAQSIKKILLIFVLLLCAVRCGQENAGADLVLTNAEVITMWDQIPSAEAVVISGDTIVFVGSNEDAMKYSVGTTKIIDLEKKTVIPGFIDSHAHFMGIGKSRMNLDLRDAKNWDEIISIVVKSSSEKKPGDWIIGRGWHQEKWASAPSPGVEGYPTHVVLSSAVPLNPVLLTHASGHAVFANALAMELAGVTDSTADPYGGRIVRDSAGAAIGVFEEDAEQLIAKVYDAYLKNKSAEELKEDNVKAASLASEECLSKGITTLHDAGVFFETIDLYKELFDLGNIRIRLNVMLGESNKNLKDKILNYRIEGYADNHLSVRSIKKYIDGALGSRGAWMLSSYDDLPGHSGINVTSLSELIETAEIAAANGFQLCTHAIGDRGVREILNIYEAAYVAAGKNMRWRVEHAQHVSDEDISRFAELGVIAAMQGIHCTSDAVFVEKRLGEKRARENSYSWRKLIDSGCIICNGTDAPVEDVDPLKSFYASVTRRLSDGSAFYPGQKMSRYEALKSYTANGAFASFDENIKGTLQPGKLADIAVLSQNILTVPDEELLNTNVLMTIVGGKILYEKK